MIRLKKNKIKDFTVLNLTDLHLIDTDWLEHSQNVINLQNTVEQLIEKASPDLITISGDFSFPKSVVPQEISYKYYADWLDSYKIPWAPVWGNHDNERGIEGIDSMAEITLSKEYSVFEKGDSAIGCGNYVISVEEDGKPIYAVVMMDSHDRAPYVNSAGKTVNAWAYLLPEQLEWYRKEIESLGNVKSAIITHIPIYAYRTAFKEAWNSEYDPKNISINESFDKKYWNDGYKDSYGINHEGANSHSRDQKVFEFIKELGSTDIILVGHDHINNFVIKYQGVALAYSLKTGTGGYHDKQIIGGTAIHISSDKRSIEHIYIDP